MARDTRVVQPRPMTFLHKDVTVADAASLNLDADSIRPRFRHRKFHDSKRTTRTTHLYRSHLGHHDLLGFDRSGDDTESLVEQEL